MSIKANTKKLLLDAFEENLKIKNIRDITIEDICSVCGACRSTFYRHFQDKYDLMNWAYKYYADDVFEQLSKIEKWKDMVLCIVQYLYSKQAYFTCIISYDEQNSFSDFFIQYGIEKSHIHLKQALGCVNLPEEIDFSIKLYAAGTAYMIKEWIHSGFHSSAEEIAQRIFDNMPMPIRRYYPS